MAPSLSLRKFTGLLPRVLPTSLPPNAAVIAQNCDFSRGDLRSIKGDFKLCELNSAARSVFSRDGLHFYTWPDDVDCAISPMRAGTAGDRLYYTTSTDFRVTPLSLATTSGGPPGSSYRVGVPRPTVALAVTVVHPTPPVAGTATVDAAPADTYATRLSAAQKALADSVVANTQITTETRVYTYAYGNAYNEQGPAAPPVTTDVKTQTYNGVTTSSKVTLQLTFEGSGDYVPITEARVFRTSSSGITNDFYFAFAVPVASGAVSVDDTTPAGSLNEVLATLDAYPPDPSLHGLVDIGNGILAAFKGREVWFSEAYRPWSWPPSYMKTLRNAVVGLLPYGAGLLATTIGSPSIFSGITPDAMSEIPIDAPQAGVSKWSMLAIDGMALYASNDGIVMLNGTQPDMGLSQRYFTREVWRGRCLNGLPAMQFAQYDGKLVVFSKTGAFTAFMLELGEADGAMTDLPNLVASTALVLTTTDQMYTVNGTALNQFGGGPDLELNYTTADIVLPAPTILAAAEIECTGPVEVRVYQEGRLGFTKTLAPGRTQFVLPSQATQGHAGLRVSDRWQFAFKVTGVMKWFLGAASRAQLKEV